MNKIILTTPDELRMLIADTVRANMHVNSVAQAASNGTIVSEPQYLNVTDAAKHLGLAEQTLYGYTSKRTIPFLKRGKRVWFLKSELDAWLLEGRKESIAQLKKKNASGNG